MQPPALDGFKIPFAAGQTRRMPRLTGGPFKYKRYADAYLDVAGRYARKPLKQAVISPDNARLYETERCPHVGRAPQRHEGSLFCEPLA